MMKDIALLRQAGALAKHAATRHSVIAENMANADTPGFRARDVAPFDARLARMAGRGDEMPKRASVPEIIRGLEASPDGNTVNLEEQMVRAVDAQAQHNAALAIYRKSMDLLRLSIRTQR